MRQPSCHGRRDARDARSKENRRAILKRIMLTDRPTTPTDAIEALLADPALQPLVAAPRGVEPPPPPPAPAPRPRGVAGPPRPTAARGGAPGARATTAAPRPLARRTRPAADER